jgi:hypothetical protein
MLDSGVGLILIVIVQTRFFGLCKPNFLAIDRKNNLYVKKHNVFLENIYYNTYMNIYYLTVLSP